MPQHKTLYFPTLLDPLLGSHLPSKAEFRLQMFLWSGENGSLLLMLALHSHLGKCREQMFTTRQFGQLRL